VDSAEGRRAFYQEMVALGERMDVSTGKAWWARIMITSRNYRRDKWTRGSHKPQDAAIMEQLLAEERYRQADAEGEAAAEQERRRQARPPKLVAL
jgi:hypothetical protein